MDRESKKHDFIASLEVGIENETAENPYSGEKVVLSPLAVALYDFIIGCQALGAGGEEFGLALEIFMEKWPEEYMVLLD
jgi:hypothetical protein